MALPAVLPELAVMSIVPGVARITIGWYRGENVVGMAARAVQVGMGASEDKAGLGVIEASRQPGRCGMALAADLAELAVMGVVLGVAGVAGGIQGSEDVAGVTFGAFHRGVSPG